MSSGIRDHVMAVGLFPQGYERDFPYYSSTVQTSLILAWSLFLFSQTRVGESKSVL